MYKTLQTIRLRESSEHSRAFLAAGYGFLRGIPFFFASTPKTPLRVLCMMAFDAIQIHRSSKAIPRTQLRALAALLDYGASANAELDNKHVCKDDHIAARRTLQEAGLGVLSDQYFVELRSLEDQRPAPFGDRQRFEEVRMYREAVARLSLRMIAAATQGMEDAENIDMTSLFSNDLELLFCIVMQCQLIDDVLDYRRDAIAGLPSFLTATANLKESLLLAAHASSKYNSNPCLSRGNAILPLRVSLHCVSALLILILGVAKRRQVQLPY